VKLLLLFDYYYPYVGGAETVNQKIAEHFSARHEAAVFTKQFQGANVPVQTINGAAVHRTANVPRLFHSLTCYLSARTFARSADCIISATYASGLAGYWLGKHFRKPSVLLVHEILGEHWRFFKKSHTLYRAYERHIVTRPFDHYIAFSSYTRKRLIDYGIADTGISFIYHGVDDALFYPRQANTTLRQKIAGSSPFVYLYFGRPGGSKGLAYLINAVPAVSRAVPGSRLVLILGAEPQKEYRQTMALIDRLGIGHAVVIHTSVPREKLPDYINIADAVVVPSLSEGFGFTAAESCAMGKPVVVTDTGSLPEVVSGRVIKVKKADSPALAGGIIRAYQGDYEALPEKKFLWKDALRQYDAILSDVVARYKE